LHQVELGRTGRDVGRIGLGAMPLSIPGRPEDRRVSLRVVRRAAELGVTLIDTADVYSLDGTDIGHNERLIREALDASGLTIGLAGDIVVATKGGLVRPHGGWERDSRPAQLRAACERSLRALGVESLDLYQLHAPDPEVRFEDSIGELARLKEDGKIRAVGLSNVDLDEIRAAQAIVEITSVQNRYNPWDRSAESEGILDHCYREGITFLPYGPVGGKRRVEALRRNGALAAIGARLGASPEEIVLAWILARNDTLVPIPGASRVESIESSVRAEALNLDAPALAEIEQAFATLAK
jgi:aryl-alcohol dehydrogenase-like predicted oxidoreductase